MNSKSIAAPRTVGLVLGNHLGDVILHSAVLKPIRDRFPQAEIILIASNPAKQLFGRSAYIDRVVAYEDVIEWPPKRVKRGLGRAVSNRLRSIFVRRFAVEILMFPSHFMQSPYLHLLQGIKAREVMACIGGSYVDIDARDWEAGITMPVRVKPDYRSKHVFEYMRQFLEELGCTESNVDVANIGFELSEKDHEEARGLISSFEGQGFGVLFPDCNFGRDFKLWPPERYGEALGLLGSAGPRNWLICGASDEAQVCQDVAKSIERYAPGMRSVVVQGQPLRHIAAVVEKAMLAMGCDNGGMHLAVASKIPTLTIVGGAVGDLYFPWGDPAMHHVVREPMDCWGCKYRCIHEEPFCVTRITAARVAKQCRLLSEDSPSARVPAGNEA